MESVDTVVVGAGLVGAAVAARLTGRLRVLEQGDQVAGEASAQNAGMVRLLVEDPVERRLALRAHELLVELDTRWEVPPSRVTGSVHGLVHEAQEGGLHGLTSRISSASSTITSANSSPLGRRTRQAWLM